MKPRLSTEIPREEMKALQNAVRKCAKCLHAFWAGDSCYTCKARAEGNEVKAGDTIHKPPKPSQKPLEYKPFVLKPKHEYVPIVEKACVTCGKKNLRSPTYITCSKLCTLMMNHQRGNEFTITWEEGQRRLDVGKTK